MRYLQWCFCLILLVGCGSPRVKAPAWNYKWSQSEFNDVVGRCTTGIDPANKPDARVTKYCQCVYQSAASRWTYSDYQSHQGDYEKILDAEVAPGCEKSALGAIAGLRRIL